MKRVTMEEWVKQYIRMSELELRKARSTKKPQIKIKKQNKNDFVCKVIKGE